MITLGVVADTHVPDRMAVIPPRAFELLHNANVAAILHAGDLSHPRVLAEFERVAPVVAVRGNRDIWWRANRDLPLERVVEFGGVKVGLTHGHGGLWGYLGDKVFYVANGYSLERYVHRVHRRFPPDVGLIVFGHTHRPTIQRINGRLLFNPGSLGPTYYCDRGPSVGLLHIESGQVNAEIILVDY